MFQNDGNEKEQRQTVHEECLVLVKTLQIRYICVCIVFEKKPSDDKTFGHKSIPDKQTFGQVFVRKF